jgi:tetratricopeptide (TPR) repeat protein
MPVWSGVANRVRRGILVSLCAAALLTSAAGRDTRDQNPVPPPKAARKAFDAAEKALDQSRIADARRAYQAAVELHPDYAEAWCGLGLLQAENGEFGAAMKSFREAIRSDPRDICPFLPLAMLEHGAGNWAALVEVTDRMLRLDSIDFPLAHLLNAAGHYNLGEFEEAERAARAAESLDARSFPKIWEILGWVAARRGNDAAAAEQFAKFLETAPPGPDAAAVRTSLARLVKRLPYVPRTAEPAPSAFRVDTNLALVPFQVLPKKGKLTAALTPEDIEVYEDGVPQKTVLFEGRRDTQSGVPVDIALLFDCSGSMQAAGAVDPYVFHTSLLDEYENVSVAIYGFTGKAFAGLFGADMSEPDLKRYTTPTRNARTLKKAMDAVLTLRPSNTPLFTSIAETVRDMAESGRAAIRMLAIFSDGMSVSVGGADLDRVEYARQEALRHGVILYPVQVVQPGSGMYVSPASIGGFEGLGRTTGGRSFIATATGSVLPNILKSLAKQVLPYTYVAGYYPGTTDSGKRHEAQVMLKNKNKGDLKGGSRTVVH